MTRREGVVASCVWDYAGQMTLLRSFWDAAHDVDPSGAATADEAAVMRWCREGELAKLWRGAGLEDVSSGSITVSASYASFEDLWWPLPAGAGPAGAFCRSLDPDKQAALHDALRLRLGVGDDPFELTARALGPSGNSRRSRCRLSDAGAAARRRRSGRRRLLEPRGSGSPRLPQRRGRGQERRSRWMPTPATTSATPAISAEDGTWASTRIPTTVAVAGRSDTISA